VRLAQLPKGVVSILLYRLPRHAEVPVRTFWGLHVITLHLVADWSEAGFGLMIKIQLSKNHVSAVPIDTPVRPKSSPKCVSTFIKPVLSWDY